MDKKDIELLKILFLESQYKSFEEIKNRYIERNLDLQKIFNQENIPKHLQGLDKNSALLKLLSPLDIYSIVSVGIYNSYMENNMPLLNNSLFSYNRLNYNRDILFSSGTDHSRFFVSSLESFAGNDCSLIIKMFPTEKGLTVQGDKFAVISCNLIISMFHKKQDWLEKSIFNAEKYLTQKIGIFDKAVINYLVSLAKSNIEEASNWLFEISKLYKKANFLHNFKNPFYKIFGLFIHGLHNFAYHTLPKSLFEKIEVPNHTVFWSEFSQYQKENNFRIGEPVIIFDGELKNLNVVNQ